MTTAKLRIGAPAKTRKKPLMAAPPCPRLAAELTKRILDDCFVDELKLDQLQGYLWFMQVLLHGGWLDPSTQIAAFLALADQHGMKEPLSLWTVPFEFSENDVKAMLVDRALFDKPLR